MAHLKLISLHCVKVNDLKQDEINILLDGKKFVGPINISKDGVHQLGGPERKFTGTIDVQLIEVDGQEGGNNDDPLGTRHVSDDLEVDRQLLSYERPGTYYTLEYSVRLT
jgi:hypothetical protein